MRYLKGTLSTGLLYKKDGSNECVGLRCWLGWRQRWLQSTSGYMFQISGTVVSWRSKKQTCMDLMTFKAEYTALASTAKEALWMRKLLTDLKQSSTRTNQEFWRQPINHLSGQESTAPRASQAHWHQVSLHSGTSGESDCGTAVLFYWGNCCWHAYQRFEPRPAHKATAKVWSDRCLILIAS